MGVFTHCFYICWEIRYALDACVSRWVSLVLFLFGAFSYFCCSNWKPPGELSQNQSMKATTRRSAARMPDHRIYLFKLSTSQGQNLDMSCNIAHRAKGTKMEDKVCVMRRGRNLAPPGNLHKLYVKMRDGTCANSLGGSSFHFRSRRIGSDILVFL